MANYKYEVLFNGDIPVKVNTLEEAEKLKDSMEKAGYNDVRVKRYWHMDELITEEQDKKFAVQQRDNFVNMMKIKEDSNGKE